MTKLMLVDDEPLVLVGLQSMLKWEDYGIEIVGTARNGARALELIQTQRPDVVVTDIKMPVMDGLELLKTSRERYGRVPLFIMLTSFEEYQFVKEAINQQAVDYLVKLELTEHALAAAIRKAQDILKDMHAGEAPVSTRVPTERFGMQPFHDRFFVRLFNHLFENKEQFEAQRRDLGVDFSFDSYAVCYCELQNLNIQGMSQEKLMNLYSSTTRMVWENVTKYMACYITSLDTQHFNITFCLSEQESPIYQEVLHNVLFKAAEVVYNYFSVRMVCAVGLKVSQPLSLSESYFTARLSLPKETGGERIAFFSRSSEADASKVFDMSHYKDTLPHAFEEMDADALEDTIPRIIESIQRFPSRRLQAMDAACNLLFMALNLLTDGETIISQIFAAEPDGYKCIYRKHSIPEIVEWMTTLKNGLVQAFGRKRGYKKKVIDEIKVYIKDNLDKHLALGDVAAVFGFSSNYLSQLFTKQAGCSFVEYITGEKVRAAKKMMQEGNIKIYEIAERLGFENAFYFSKVFKKVEGCSPKKYLQRRA